ncbi:MAG: hypothetical protein K5874_01285 [Bacteroidaceae bacterium]|nr:hypothetical protein [Bacteroidaceae bacterium]
MNGYIKKIIGHQVIRLVTILLGFYSLLSCSHSHYINVDHVEYIKFAYLPKGLETIKGLSSWEDVVSHENKIDTIIDNTKFISEYVDLLNSTLETEDSVSRDFRVVSLIKLNNGKEHYVCLGENNGIYYDSIILQDNKQIFDFIDQHLYTKEQLRKFHLMFIKHFCSDTYLQSNKFDTDFDSLYHHYLINNDYDSYSTAIWDIVENLSNDIVEK